MFASVGCAFLLRNLLFGANLRVTGFLLQRFGGAGLHRRTTTTYAMYGYVFRRPAQPIVPNLAAGQLFDAQHLVPSCQSTDLFSLLTCCTRFAQEIIGAGSVRITPMFSHVG